MQSPPVGGDGGSGGGSSHATHTDIPNTNMPIKRNEKYNEILMS